MIDHTQSAAAIPEKVGDRVITPNGTKGYIALVHPTLKGAVFVQPDTPPMCVYMREELKLDDD